MAKKRNILQDVIVGEVREVNLAAASQSLVKSQTHQIFICVVDAVMTLPLCSTELKGVGYTFVCGALSAGTGLDVTPQAADNIYGAGLTAVDDESIINSGATDVVGDQVTLVCDGTNWLVTNIIGTWAKA
jgi:hypothetical protein